MSDGRLFHARGPALANARSPMGSCNAEMPLHVSCRAACAAHGIGMYICIDFDNGSTPRLRSWRSECCIIIIIIINIFVKHHRQSYRGAVNESIRRRLAVICNLLYFVLCVCLFYFFKFLIQPSGCNYL